MFDEVGAVKFNAILQRTTERRMRKSLDAKGGDGSIYLRGRIW